MIHLDTNALIALPWWSRENHPAIRRVADGEPAAASALVWYEFLVGPVSAEEVRLALSFIRGRVVPVDADAAQRAAELFNNSGRRRPLKTDALIAAVAIQAGAEFLTLNVDDFRPFVAGGLKLLSP